MPMTPKERWLAVLKRQKPDRVPMDYWGTGEATERLMKHLDCADDEALMKKLHIDRPFAARPEYVGPEELNSSAYLPPYIKNVFGIKGIQTVYGEGAASGIYNRTTYYPLAEFNTVEEIEKNYRWPDPDWWDYSVIPGSLRGKEEYPIMGGISEPLLTYKQLRGDVQAYIDFLENPELAKYCIDKLFELTYLDILRTYEAAKGKIDITWVNEDFGSQEDLLVSPKIIKDFFLPGMKKLIDLVHAGGGYVFHHSDGAVRKNIPVMIEAGIDILNPVQWRCAGMDREELKKSFGDKIIFHGAVDNQQTLPFETVKEVREEVLYNLRVLGKGGGYILAPCHNIQVNTPPENVVELYETGYHYGKS